MLTSPLNISPYGLNETGPHAQLCTIAFPFSVLHRCTVYVLKLNVIYVLGTKIASSECLHITWFNRVHIYWNRESAAETIISQLGHKSLLTVVYIS